MKTILAFALLCFYLPSFSQADTMFGKQIIFNRTAGSQLQKTGDILDSVPFTPGEKWTVQGIYKGRDYLFIGEKSDSAHMWKILFNIIFKQGSIFTYDYFTVMSQKYPKTINALLNGQIWIGIPEDAFQLAFGKPDKINITITASNVSKQYVYGSSYYYFENGKLTTIQAN